MHNVKRLTAAARAAKRKENEERAAGYRARSAKAMEQRANRAYDAASLEATARVVTENPDFATMWNFRRDILRHLHPDDAETPEAEVVAARKAAWASGVTAEQTATQLAQRQTEQWQARSTAARDRHAEPRARGSGSSGGGRTSHLTCPWPLAAT